MDEPRTPSSEEETPVELTAEQLAELRSEHSRIVRDQHSVVPSTNPPQLDLDEYVPRDDVDPPRRSCEVEFVLDVRPDEGINLNRPASIKRTHNQRGIERERVLAERSGNKGNARDGDERPVFTNRKEFFADAAKKLKCTKKVGSTCHREEQEDTDYEKQGYKLLQQEAYDSTSSDSSESEMEPHNTTDEGSTSTYDESDEEVGLIGALVQPLTDSMGTQDIAGLCSGAFSTYRSSETIPLIDTDSDAEEHESKQVHGEENEVKQVHGEESESKQVHGEENRVTQVHAEVNESNTTHISGSQPERIIKPTKFRKRYFILTEAEQSESEESLGSEGAFSEEGSLVEFIDSEDVDVQEIDESVQRAHLRELQKICDEEIKVIHEVHFERPQPRYRPEVSQSSDSIDVQPIQTMEKEDTSEESLDGENFSREAAIGKIRSHLTKSSRSAPFDEAVPSSSVHPSNENDDTILPEYSTEHQSILNIIRTVTPTVKPVSNQIDENTSETTFSKIIEQKKVDSSDLSTPSQVNTNSNPVLFKRKTLKKPSLPKPEFKKDPNGGSTPKKDQPDENDPNIPNDSIFSMMKKGQ